MRKLLLLFIFFNFYLISNGAFAATKVVNLVVAYKTVHFAGKKIQAIAVNNQIPAPALHFKEGDHVVINVFNHLNEGTIIHWHGIILPWQMDGVEGISQPAIAPGKMFRYHFTIRQSGTYWYHAHAGFQEQQGLYGALVFDPKTPPKFHYKKDFVMVLSDWSNTNPNQIFSNLKKDGDYYSPRFPLQASLFKFIHDYRKSNPEQKKLLWRNYKIMQQSRMGLYDLSDVAYDAFLLNGKSNVHPWTGLVKTGDIVRLRFIDAGASTNFHIKIPGHILKIIQVDGNDIKPIDVKHFFITPAETYDVLVKITDKTPAIIYAESSDTIGAAMGALITHQDQQVNYKAVKPFPEPIPVTQEMMNNMMQGMGHEPMHDMKKMKTPGENYSSMQMNTTMKNINPKSNSMHSAHADHMSKSSSSMMDMPDMKHNHETQEIKKIPNAHDNHSSKSMSHVVPMSNMDNMQNTHAKNNAMNTSMPIEPSIIGDHFEKMTPKIAAIKTIGTKYQNLIALRKTNNPNKPISGVMRMELFGYMGRTIWMINGLPEYKAKPIILEPGKRYRIIFTNQSMMHHPMHMHGHWFILRNGHGPHDPLLHTIDVAPGATVVADIDADASGQWFFHCHHLYHMMAGMARVFQYQTIINIVNGTQKPTRFIGKTGFYNRPIVRVDEDTPIIPALIHHPMGHPARFYTANFLDVGNDFWNNTQQITFKGLYGGDYNKLKLYTENAEIEKGKVTDADIDIFYWHLINQFWAIEGGANYFYRPAQNPYWQPGIGIDGLMPYFIDTEFRVYEHNGCFKFDPELSRDTQITNNFFIRTGIEGILATKTVSSAAIGGGLNEMQYTVRPFYRVKPGMNVFVQYQYTKDYGALASYDRQQNESPNQNLYTLGLTLLF